ARALKPAAGKPGAIESACCRTPLAGKTSRALKRTATRCVALNGGNACVGAVPSCCDACDAGGCATTTPTPSPSTTTTAFPPPCGPQAGGAPAGTSPPLLDLCGPDPLPSACGGRPRTCPPPRRRS